MEMSIDKSTRILVDRYIDTYVVCGGANYNPTINITREDYEAFKVATDTMRKYQKIKEQVNIAIDKENFAISDARLIHIREIIDGNEAV